MNSQGTPPPKAIDPITIVTEQTISVASARPKSAPAPYSALKRFVRLHDRALVIFALFIVTGSFLIKDVYRDDLRELRTSISEAENTFRTREAFILIRKEVIDIQDRLDNPQNWGLDGGLLEPSPGPPRSGNTNSLPDEKSSKAIPAAPTHNSPQLTLMDAIVRLRDECGAVEEEMENISDIASVLPTTDSSDVDVADLKLTADGVSHAWTNILNNEKTTGEEKIKLASSALTDAQNAEEELLAATPRILDMARAEEKSQLRWYRIVEVATVLSFVLGLVMGLLGRIYDVKGMVGV